jgi:superfamily I DNA and/or RNA helicase
MLSEQHRMHPEIATLVSQAFYKGTLKTANTCAVAFRTEPRPFRSLNARRLPDVPIVWISTPWVQNAAGRRKSEQRPGPFNREEVHLALQTLRTIEPIEPSAPEAARPTLALLSPYRAQVRALQTALNQADPALRRRLHQFEPVGGRYAHTVDSFQGREADLVIVSLVRNNHRESLRGALGFLADARRMNVLVSRARWCLVLIGSRDFLNDVVARFKEGPTLTELEFLQRLLRGIDAAENRGQAATWSISP